MHHSRTRWLLLGLVSTAAFLSSACGAGSSGDGGHPVAFDDATAVSANVSGALPPDGIHDPKGLTSKVDPMVRPGVEAPLDSATDLPGEPIDGATTSPETASRRFASGFGTGVILTPPSLRDGDRHLTGADADGDAFPLDLWASQEGKSSWVLSSVGPHSAAPATDFLAASLKQVASRHGGFTSALSLHSSARSASTGNHFIAVQDYGMATEPVMYQRMWVKFDSTLADRARKTGGTFQQTFWEASAADYRLQLQVRHDAGGLYWHATADRRNGGAPAWKTDLKASPIVLAAADAAAGWHRVEIWMDRPNGQFKVAIDGRTLVDHANGIPGDGSKRIQELRLMMFNGGKAQLGEMLFDDLEIWDAPPMHAWAVE